MDEIISFRAKVCRNGGSLVVTIPADIVKSNDIRENDILELIEMKKV